ncbi:MAG TPA: FUSC family protein [Lapillicoccus sp.]
MALLPDRATVRRRFSAEWPQILRIVIAGVVSWGVCKLIDTSSVPIFAVVAPLVAMRDQPFSALNVSFDRIAGVIVGVLLGLAVVNLVGSNVLSVALVLAIGLLIGVVLRVGVALNIQVSLTGLLVFTSIDPGTYGFTRLWETLIGAAVTVVLSPFLLPPDAGKLYRAEFRRVSARLGEHTAQAAVLVAEGGRNHEVIVGLLAEVRTTHDSANMLPTHLESARRAVRNNPLRRRKIGELDALVEVTGTVVETAQWLRLLAEELVDLSGRRDVDPLWATSGPWVARVLQPVATVIDAALVRETTATGEKRTMAEATKALAEWRRVDPHPIAVILRRSCFRLVRAVGRLVSEEIAVPPGGPTHVEDVVDTTVHGPSNPSP